MGKQSSLGPIDPQIRGMPAHGVIEEFNQAFKEITEDPKKIPIWQAKIAAFPPAFIGECQKAIRWSEEMVKEWLQSGMFEDEIKHGNQQVVNQTIDIILKEFGDHALTKSHARHISLQKCKDMGLRIETMEDIQNLQEAILTLHHITMRTLIDTPAVKIVENQEGKAYIQTITIQ